MDQAYQHRTLWQIAEAGKPVIMYGTNPAAEYAVEAAFDGSVKTGAAVDLSEIAHEALPALFSNADHSPLAATFTQPHLADQQTMATLLHLMTEQPLGQSFMAIVVPPEHAGKSQIPTEISSKMTQLTVNEDSTVEHPAAAVANGENQLAGYFIRIPQHHVPELAHFLAEHGVEFDAINDLTACHSELFMDQIWTGHYGQELINDINDHLVATRHLRITTAFADMTPSQQWSVLLYATLHCEWTVDYDQRELTSTDVQELEKLQAKDPQLFG